MKNVTRLVISVLAIMFIMNSGAYSLPDSLYVPQPLKKDTVFYKLKFYQGDTLYYDVVVHDSIVINYGKPLIKRRYENIKIVCDSVSARGTFYLSHTMLGFYEESANPDTTGVERTESPWIDRTVYYEIDSVGRRYSYNNSDVENAAMSPGGAFQPHLFFPFEKDTGITKESWLVDSYDNLVENAFPVPLVRQKSMFKTHLPHDTLGYRCNRFEYIKTGQGSFSLIAGGNKIKVTSILTGFGILDIADNINLPVHYYATVEQKIKYSEGNQQHPTPGKVHMVATFILDKLVPGKDRPKIKR